MHNCNPKKSMKKREATKGNNLRKIAAVMLNLKNLLLTRIFRDEFPAYELCFGKFSWKNAKRGFKAFFETVNISIRASADTKGPPHIHLWSSSSIIIFSMQSNVNIRPIVSFAIMLWCCLYLYIVVHEVTFRFSLVFQAYLALSRNFVRLGLLGSAQAAVLQMLQQVHRQQRYVM